MLRLVLFLLVVSALAFGLSWLADRPGSLVIQWQGYEIETSVFRAIVILTVFLGLAIVLWSVLRQIWNSPAAIGRFFNQRRQKRGFEALSSGMIAIGAGDRALATRYAIQARKTLPNEPLTHLLRAQAAQLSGDRATARRIFEAMLASPDTEQLGLRGLFLEAEREGDQEAARHFAERAMALNPKLAWPVEALFDIQCRKGDWKGALETLEVARRHHHIDKTVADRRRAVLLTAQAQEVEDTDPDRAMTLALEAHYLAPDLVPAAAIAGRALAARGNTRKAARILQRTWKRSPHPDIATAYAYARIGDSPRDRLDRVKQLAALRPHSIESAIAVATAAIEAKDWYTARHALDPLLSNAPTQRVCTLMARIEAEQHGDAGKVREWLARAVSAPRDPVWTADGVVSEHWAPVSPVTGALDAFQWRIPVEAIDKSDTTLLSRKMEELVALSAGPEPANEHPTIEASPARSETMQQAAADAEIIEEIKKPTPEQQAQPEPVAATSSAPSVAEPKHSSKPGSADQPAAAAPGSKTAVAQPASSPKTEPDLSHQQEVKPEARPTEPAGSPNVATAPEPKTEAPAKAAAPAVQPNTTPVGTSKESRPAAVVNAQLPSMPYPPPYHRQSSRPAEPRIVVPPRAPDDPGPDGLDVEDDAQGAGLGFALPVKGSSA